MANHPLFIPIGNTSPLKLSHLFKGLLHKRFHELEKIVRKIHSAEIEHHADLRVYPQVFPVSLPKLKLIHSPSGRYFVYLGHAVAPVQLEPLPAVQQ